MTFMSKAYDLKSTCISIDIYITWSRYAVEILLTLLAIFRGIPHAIHKGNPPVTDSLHNVPVMCIVYGKPGQAEK